MWHLNCMKTKDFLANFPWAAKFIVCSHKVSCSSLIQVSIHMLTKLEKAIKWKASSNLNNFGFTLPASKVHGKQKINIFLDKS